MNDSPEPESSFPESRPERRSILPELVTRPLTCLVVVVLPQLILLVLNLRAWHLMSGEVDELQRDLAFLFFAGEGLVLLLGAGVAALHLWKRKETISWAWFWILFLPTTVYLGLFLTHVGKVIPDALEAWIVIPETLIFYQFVFLMPSLFLATLALACFPVRKGVGKDVGISVAVALGVPGFWYVMLHLADGFGLDRIPAFVLFLIVTVMSLLCLGGILRILSMLFVGALGKGVAAQTILVGLVAIAGPVAGLLLNRAIPFPSSFQIWPVYGITVLNGFLLTLPRFRRASLNRIVWLLQCGLFPFTLYFFLIFLPYLPLAALAVIAAGAGFLILSPTALFVIHLRKLVQNFPSPRWIVFGVLSALVLPGYLHVEMKLDRVVLHRAIDYVYSPATDGAGEFTGDRDWLRRSLIRMKRVKEGVYLPFLTEWYEEVVLDGLVLSDEKLNHLHYTFFGESMPEVESGANLFGTSRASRNRGRPRATVPPPSHAILKQLSHERNGDGSGMRTLVKLELHNPSSVQSEYATSVSLPEGTVISGYWLHVGEERVPGQIFERKTAMWVYRMIRDSRRDPGLLTYRTPTELSLRVFPLAAGETRVTEIEFLSPPGVAPELRIGDKTIPGGNAGGEIRPILWESSEDAVSLYLPTDFEPKSPGFRRRPYFHFLVDRSHSGLEPAEALETMRFVAKRFPEVDRFRISAVNYEFGDDEPELNAISELSEKRVAQSIGPLPLRGAYLSGIAVQRALAQRLSDADAGDLDAMKQFPVFVLIRSSRTVETTLPELVWAEKMHPESRRYFVAVAGGETILAKGFAGREEEVKLLNQPVFLLSSGKQLRAVPADGLPRLLRFDSGEEPRLYEPGQDRFLPLSTLRRFSGESAYAGAMEVHRLEDELHRFPSRGDVLLPRLVEASRASGILSPSTAYIVVENSAQWKMLKRKEKEKLKGNRALDFMEAPEPAVVWVALLFLLFLASRRGWASRVRLSKLKGSLRTEGARGPVDP